MNRDSVWNSWTRVFSLIDPHSAREYLERFLFGSWSRRSLPRRSTTGSRGSSSKWIHFAKANNGNWPSTLDISPKWRWRWWWWWCSTSARSSSSASSRTEWWRWRRCRRGRSRWEQWGRRRGRRRWGIIGGQSILSSFETFSLLYYTSNKTLCVSLCYWTGLLVDQTLDRSCPLGEITALISIGSVSVESSSGLIKRASMYLADSSACLDLTSVNTSIRWISGENIYLHFT